MCLLIHLCVCKLVSVFEIETEHPKAAIVYCARQAGILNFSEIYNTVAALKMYVVQFRGR